jgi:hypothetical protein
VDVGFRGVDGENPGVEILHRGKTKRLSLRQRRWLKRRSAADPVIGHLKADHRMARCWLAGAKGDTLHAVPCAAGYNVRWLMRAVAHLGLRGFFCALGAVRSLGEISSDKGIRKVFSGIRCGRLVVSRNAAGFVAAIAVCRHCGILRNPALVDEPYEEIRSGGF